MNKKVVVIWSVGIIACFALGYLGYQNRDLREREARENEPYQPLGSGDKKICRLSLEKYNSIYNFSLKENDIDNLTITYESKVEDSELYDTAVSLNEKLLQDKITGLNLYVSGEKKAFTMQFIVDMKKLDLEALSEIDSTLSKYNVVIDKETSYKSYLQSINGLGNNYNCE